MNQRRRHRTLIALLLLLLAGLAAYGALAGTVPFVGPPADAAAMTYSGAGGDPALLDALRARGVELRRVHDLALDDLRRALGDAADGSILYRGQVRHNLWGGGLGEFTACVYGRPFAAGLLRGADGRPFACAVSDAGGYYTFVGLPADAEVTFTITRPGFLELAYTARAALPPVYEQDYVGNVPAYLARGAYRADPRYPFCAAGSCPRGELIFTIVDDPRPPDDPLHGYVSRGVYAGNGAAGATVRLFTDADGDGTFATPYPSDAPGDPAATQPDDIPDGLVYVGSIEEQISHATGGRFARMLDWFARIGLAPVLRGQAYPQLWRGETSEFGLAMLKYAAPGLYEAEVAHPSRTCRPAKHAWTGSTPARLRFEIVPGALGDVHFYCAATP